MPFFFSKHSLAHLASFHWIVAIAVFVVWLAVLFVAKWVAFAAVRRASRMRLPWLETVLSALSPAVNVLIIATGLAFAANAASLPTHWQRIVGVALIAGTVLGLVIFFDGILRLWMRREASRFPMFGESYSLVTAAVRGLVIGLGLLMFLESVGISVTPIIASLGIGSLALALALQETAKNMFSGFFVILDKSLEVGDYVKLATGQEGWLISLGWRSSKFRMLNDTIVIVPNSALVDSILTNYRAPDGALALEIDVSVVATNDLDKVEFVTKEVASDVMQTVEGGVAGFRPSVYFGNIGVGAIGLSVFLRVSSGASMELVRHEFIKRLTARYVREGIKIP
jgi:small-conductance mechanosensitive channel